SAAAGSAATTSRDCASLCSFTARVLYPANAVGPRPPACLMAVGGATPARSADRRPLFPPVLRSGSGGDALSHTAPHSQRRGPSEGSCARHGRATLPGPWVRGAPQTERDLVLSIDNASRSSGLGELSQ